MATVNVRLVGRKIVDLSTVDDAWADYNAIAQTYSLNRRDNGFVIEKWQNNEPVAVIYQWDRNVDESQLLNTYNTFATIANASNYDFQRVAFNITPPVS